MVSYFSGIVDENDAIRLGGYPGAFRELLGVRTEEFHPLLPGESVALDDGSTATVWTEDLHLEGAEALVRYVDGPRARPAGGHAARQRDVRGHPARRRRDRARCWRASARQAGVRPVVEGLPRSVEAVRRRGEHDYLFLLNHGPDPVSLPVSGVDLLSGREGAVGARALRRGGGARCSLGSARSGSSRRCASAAARGCPTSSSCSASRT